MPTDAADELVEVVDPDGTVERIVSRSEMRAGNLRHRATYIVVRNTEGDVLVHLRAPWKDIWPSRWDLAFGGVCGVGEDWRDAALRELAEEAGIVAEIHDLGPVRFESSDTAVVGRVFHTTHAGSMTFGDGEVVDIAWVPGRDLARWAATHELCPDSAAVVLPLAAELESC